MKFAQNKKVIALVLVAVFILSLVPMLVISFYNFPSADDFSYGLKAAQAWRESGSVINVVGAAGETVVKYYEKWQGTFTATFLFALTPSVFSERAYFIVTFILIGMLIFGTMFISKTLLMDCLKADKWQRLIITLIPLGASMQLLPSAFQGFFWWNGAVFYTFFYSLALVYFALVLKVLKSERHRVRQIIAIALLAFLLGGGSYPVALVTCEISFLFAATAFFRKNKNALIVATGFIFSLAGLAVSAFAPGNAVRQTAFKGLPPLEAITMSFSKAFESMGSWLSAPLILCFLLITPLLFGVASKLDFPFRFPPLVTLISFGVFSSFFTPSLYAMGDSIIPDRYLNIIYYAFYWLLLINIFYYSGWLNMRFSKLFIGIGAKLSKYAVPLLFVAVFAVGYLSYSEIYRFTTVSAMNSLSSGEARAYYEEQNARLALYKDPNVSVVEVRAISTEPYVLYDSDFHVTSNKDNWCNVATAKYYDKEKVVLLP